MSALPIIDASNESQSPLRIIASAMIAANANAVTSTGDSFELDEHAEFQSLMTRVSGGSKMSDTEMMSTPTREELDAKFERTEARVDARLAEFQRTNAETLHDIKLEVQKIHADLATVKNFKANLWSATALIVVTVFGTVFAAFSLGFGAFDSGRDTAALVGQAKKEMEEASVQNAKMKADTQQLLRDAINVMSQKQTPVQ